MGLTALSGIGSVQPLNAISVKVRVDGQLDRVAFTEGQDVHKGDVLAQIDPRSFRAQLKQAQANKAKDEAQLANARLDLERSVRLEARGVPPNRASIRSGRRWRRSSPPSRPTRRRSRWRNCSSNSRRSPRPSPRRTPSRLRHRCRGRAASAARHHNRGRSDALPGSDALYDTGHLSLSRAARSGPWSESRPVADRVGTADERPAPG
jgi:hypothetical protein